MNGESSLEEVNLLYEMLSPFSRLSEMSRNLLSFETLSGKHLSCLVIKPKARDGN